MENPLACIQRLRVAVWAVQTQLVEAGGARMTLTRTRRTARIGMGVKRRIAHLKVAASLSLIALMFGCKPADKPANGNRELPPDAKLRPVYEKGINATKEVEGFRAKLYTDAARNCTIGYGHQVKKGGCDGDEPAEFRRGITEV